MSRVYEVMFIIRPDVDDDEAEKLITGFTSTVSSHGRQVFDRRPVSRCCGLWISIRACEMALFDRYAPPSTPAFASSATGRQAAHGVAEQAAPYATARITSWPVPAPSSLFTGLAVGRTAGPHLLGSGGALAGRPLGQSVHRSPTPRTRCSQPPHLHSPSGRSGRHMPRAFSPSARLLLAIATGEWSWHSVCPSRSGFPSQFGSIVALAATGNTSTSLKMPSLVLLAIGAGFSAVLAGDGRSKRQSLHHRLLQSQAPRGVLRRIPARRPAGSGLTPSR